MTVMQSSIRTVCNAQKQYGLRVREIMVEITRVSEALGKGSAPPRRTRTNLRLRRMSE
jgi:hypothetical protein